MGFASCWVGAFDENEVAKVIGLQNPKDCTPISLLPLGYAAENVKTVDRRQLKDMCKFIE